MRRASTWIAAVVVGVAGGWAAAQAAACPLPSEPLPALAAVVRLLEPALPRSLVVARVELPREHPDHEDLLYLRERRVLPRGVEADPLGAEAWQEALDTIAGWYGAPGVVAGDPQDAAAVAADLAALIEQAGRAVRPAALFAWEPDDRSRLAFQGLVWNWSAYPRLIVRRVEPTAARVLDDLRTMARSMSTCAFVVESYLAASAPVARDLFLAENRARMYIVGSEPDLPGSWPVEVPPGEEVDVFGFSHPLVASLDTYAAVFVGDGAQVFTVVRLLPQVRTNLSPFGIARLLALPPR